MDWWKSFNIFNCRAKTKTKVKKKQYVNVIYSDKIGHKWKKMGGEKRKKGKVTLYFWVGQSVLVFLTRLGLDSPKISFEVLFAITTSIFYPMLWSKIACYFSLLDGSHVAPSLSEISLWSLLLSHWSLLLSHCVESSGAYGSLWRWKDK